jgi:hypothetical protein
VTGEPNAWAGRADLVPPNVPLVPLPARDPLDRGDVGAFLGRLALLRGEGAVVADVRRWPREVRP